MVDAVNMFQSALGTGADAALIVIGVAIFKVERRVFRLEMKLDKLKGL